MHNDGKTYLGYLDFKDGHIEEILEKDVITDDLVHVKTKSGWYAYRKTTYYNIDGKPCRYSTEWSKIDERGDLFVCNDILGGLF